MVYELGEPTTVTRRSDNSRQILYLYTQQQINPLNLVPVVGAFVRGGDTEQSQTLIECTPDGILANYTVTQGQMKVGTGIISGQKQR